MNAKGCTTCANYSMVCRKCVESGNFSEYTEKSTEPVILDSGERREFESGAVRDMTEGKGRCDLLPLSIVAKLVKTVCPDSNYSDDVLCYISAYLTNHDCGFLQCAIECFCDVRGWDIYEAIFEVSKHFEAGAKKYGERNWEKGLPEYCYASSAIRHYLKWLKGMTDEPHDRAVIWNLMCLWWTHENLNSEANEE